MSSGVPAKKRMRGMDKEVIMDTSEQYIKMCEKAEEIQKKWKPTEADFMYNFAVGEVAFIRVNRTTDRRRRYHSIPYNKDRFFWLPRQDQLQEMVRRPKYSQSPVRLVHRFYDWLKSLAVEEDGETYYNNSNLNYESLEQLWLAFMMEERYDKVWDGKDWSNHAIL